MLRWTSAGAVTAPTTVQIRVQQRHPGRIAAGAPSPTRGMTTAEIAANLRHFTVSMRTPRTRPCTALVLSGGGVAARSDLLALLSLARDEGVQRVVLHAGSGDIDPEHLASWQGLVHALVVPLHPTGQLDAAASAVRRARAAGLDVYTNTVLDAPALPRLREVADLLVRLGQSGHTFTYPFPTGPQTTQQAPPPAAAVRALDRAMQILDAHQLAVGIKGLPACYLGVHGQRLRRTSNRWYVDADHQQDQALLFFPDVVAFHKGEACRFCASADRCDGFFAAYLRREGAQPLVAQEPADPAG